MSSAYQEPLSGHLRLVHGETRVEIPRLRYISIRATDGFALRLSPTGERVYLLEQLDQSEVPVPYHMCGEWPAGTTARTFLYPHDPDGALDNVTVRETRAFIGFVAFPSGWMATPWMADPDPEALSDRLEHTANVMLGRPTLVDARRRDLRVPR